jgi:hypothetical protein
MEGALPGKSPWRPYFVLDLEKDLQAAPFMLHVGVSRTGAVLIERWRAPRLDAPKVH